MQQQSPTDRRKRLLPAGRRWGFGAQSVTPYLASLQSRGPQPEDMPAEEQFIRNPVFVHMEHTLRALTSKH
jgi:hypothetical protein